MNWETKTKTEGRRESKKNELLYSALLVCLLYVKRMRNSNLTMIVYLDKHQSFFNFLEINCTFLLEKQYNAIQYNTNNNTMQYNTIQYNTIQCNAMQYNTIQYNTIQYNTIQYNTMQCNAMQCNAMQCNAMQCNTIQQQKQCNSPGLSPKICSAKGLKGRKRQLNDNSKNCIRIISLNLPLWKTSSFLSIHHTAPSQCSAVFSTHAALLGASRLILWVDSNGERMFFR